ncbi:MAG: ArsR family transcriptional regulator [Gemmatimonadetes bacterium]|nr:ArsR family transcriptional regulator [Gemmatimonadota bacterium]
MPRSGNGNPIHLDLIPEARREIIRLLKRRGPLPVEDIADHLEVTVSGARQHLSSLERDGVVTYQRLRQGPGRPRHFYELTERGDALFPRRYAELLNELLGYVRESDPSLVDRVFTRRAQRRAEASRGRIVGGTLEERVREVARLLDEEGYYPQLESLENGGWRVVVRNCPVRALGERYTSACAGEVTFLRRLLPTDDVRRTGHILNGQPFCAYEIHPGAAEPAAAGGVQD